MSIDKDSRNANELDDNQLEQVSGGLTIRIIPQETDSTGFAGGIVGYSDNEADIIIRNA